MAKNAARTAKRLARCAHPIRGMSCVLGAAVVLAAACLPARIEGQAAWPVGIEANLGFGGGRTAGDYRQQSLMLAAADLQLTARLRELSRGSIVAGLSASGVGAAHDAMCVVRPEGGCVPHYPDFALYSTVLGWENARARTRLSTGPVYARAGAGAWGWVARWDGAVPLFLHVSITASLRGYVIPDYRGDSFQLFGFGLGGRIR